MIWLISVSESKIISRNGIYISYSFDFDYLQMIIIEEQCIMQM